MIAVAHRLNRRWIGIDIIYQSIALILKRLLDKYSEDYTGIEANILLDGFQGSRPGDSTRLDLPMVRSDAVESAAAIGDADRQQSLL
jgi:hypothetical protein